MEKKELNIVGEEKAKQYVEEKRDRSYFMKTNSYTLETSAT